MNEAKTEPEKAAKQLTKKRGKWFKLALGLGIPIAAIGVIAAALYGRTKYIRNQLDSYDITTHPDYIKYHKDKFGSIGKEFKDTNFKTEKEYLEAKNNLQEFKNSGRNVERGNISDVIGEVGQHKISQYGYGIKPKIIEEKNDTILSKVKTVLKSTKMVKNLGEALNSIKNNKGEIVKKLIAFGIPLSLALAAIGYLMFKNRKKYDIYGFEEEPKELQFEKFLELQKEDRVEPKYGYGKFIKHVRKIKEIIPQTEKSMKKHQIIKKLSLPTAIGMMYLKYRGIGNEEIYKMILGYNNAYYKMKGGDIVTKSQLLNESFKKYNPQQRAAINKLIRQSPDIETLKKKKKTPKWKKILGALGITLGLGGLLAISKYLQYRNGVQHSIEENSFKDDVGDKYVPLSKEYEQAKIYNELPAGYVEPKVSITKAKTGEWVPL